MNLNRHNYSEQMATVTPVIGFDLFSKTNEADPLGQIVSNIFKP